jgi:hypothetical protein
MRDKLKIVLGASALLALVACARVDGPVHDVYYDGYRGLLDDGSGEPDRSEAQCADDDRSARPCADAQDQGKHGPAAQGM